MTTPWGTALSRTAILLAGGLAACRPEPPSTPIEAAARADVPIPICVSPLPEAPSAELQSIGPAQYWSTLLPSYQEGQLVPLASACNGEALLHSLYPSSATPIRVDPTKMVLATSTNGFRTAWLPIYHIPNTDKWTGVLALLRRREFNLEVYAVGLSTGDPDSSQFSIESLAGQLIVVARHEDCDAESVCNTTDGVYLAKRGQLTLAAEFPTARLLSVANSSSAAKHYTFRANVEYLRDTIVLTEALSVRDRDHVEIRSSQLIRSLRVTDGAIFSSVPSLWKQVQDDTSP